MEPIRFTWCIQQQQSDFLTSWLLLYNVAHRAFPVPSTSTSHCAPASCMMENALANPNKLGHSGTLFGCTRINL